MVQGKKDIIKYKNNRNLDSLDDTIKKMKSVSIKVTTDEFTKETTQMGSPRGGNKRMKIDPKMKAKMRRTTFKKLKYDLKDLQKLALTRQKKLNRFNKHKKRFLRMREKINFEKVMATRLNDDSQDDLDFNDNSSIESEHDDIRYLNYVKAMKDNYNSGVNLHVDAKTGIE